MNGAPARAPFPGRRRGPAGLGAALALGTAALLFSLSGCAGPPSRPAPAPSAEPASGSLNGLPLRVLLRIGSQGLRASAPGGLRLLGMDGGTLAAIPADARAGLSASEGRLRMNGDDLGADRAWITALKPGEGVSVAGRHYRGRLLLRALGSRLALVNVVGLEDYLRAVLPCEVESGGPAEALEAQAVAARGFALWQMRNAVGRPWDLDNSSDSQVYGSREAERPSTDEAVAATRGQVLAWQGQPARTYFHSNSGGATADAQEVWNGSEVPPYLGGVSDPWSEDQPHYRWTWSLPLGEAEERLRDAGLLDGSLEGVEPGRRTASGRWKDLVLRESDGHARRVGANAFRRALGADRLRSTRFSVRLEGGTLSFRGLGWGHGVGLSQEGAFAQARAGWDYRGILYYYYPGTGLATVGE